MLPLALVIANAVWFAFSFNGHPPLGVNATYGDLLFEINTADMPYRFNGHPPLGVNATPFTFRGAGGENLSPVSMGTHPWG